MDKVSIFLGSILLLIIIASISGIMTYEDNGMIKTDCYDRNSHKIDGLECNKQDLTIWGIKGENIPILMTYSFGAIILIFLILSMIDMYNATTRR